MNVIIAGVRRSATTSLYNYLAQHPQMRKAVDGDPKWEVHFFDRHENWSKGAKWYREQFPRRYGQLGIDKTPTYLQLPYVPDRVRKIVPAASIIVMLRNPVDRAYSDYNKRKQEGYEERSWQSVLKAENLGYVRPHKARFWMSKVHLFGYLERSDYIPQLQAWFRAFDKDQIMVLQYEYFRSHTQEVLGAVFAWLGLDPVKVDTAMHWQKEEYEPMPARVLGLLTDRFKHQIAQTTIPFAVGQYPWW